MIFYYTTSSISWRAIIRNIRLQESEDKCENILGVIFQRDLKWNKQVLAVCAKLKQRLGGLSKIRHVANTRTKKLVADGIFRSILTYCIPVWGGMDQNSLIPYQVNLEVFQESATSRMSWRSGWCKMFSAFMITNLIHPLFSFLFQVCRWSAVIFYIFLFSLFSFFAYAKGL